MYPACLEFGVLAQPERSRQSWWIFTVPIEPIPPFDAHRGAVGSHMAAYFQTYSNPRPLRIHDIS